VSELLTKGKGNGPEGVVSGNVAKALQEKLAEGAWRTAEGARRWLKEEHGVQVKGSNIYAVLNKARRASEGSAPGSQKSRS